MLGIYTPTHDPHWLKVPYRTLKQQDFDCWLVLLNGEATIDEVPQEIREDSRVVIESSEEEGIGALKKDACARLLTRPVTQLVELDHDDELAVGALDQIRRGKEEEFLFSDTASKTHYGKEWGWSSRSEVVNGERLWVHDTPEVCARSLFEIFYAPNHVRVWGRKAYEKVGGYSAELDVCDDHDLLCRTYLQGLTMSKVQQPLYVQNEHKDQTQLQNNKRIQTEQARIGEEYLYDLVLEEARRTGRAAIDLGGDGTVEGYQSLNVRGSADILADATKPLPFEDDSVQVFRAHDFLEHIPIGQVVPLLNEIYRCLVPGGWLLTSTPSTDGRGAFQDPTHVSFWNSNSWWYYTKQALAKYVPDFVGRFQLARVVNDYPSGWHAQHNIIYVHAALWALKGQRQIGAVEI